MTHRENKTRDHHQPNKKHRMTAKQTNNQHKNNNQHASTSPHDSYGTSMTPHNSHSLQVWVHIHIDVDKTFTEHSGQSHSLILQVFHNINTRLNNHHMNKHNT